LRIKRRSLAPSIRSWASVPVDGGEIISADDHLFHSRQRRHRAGTESGDIQADIPPMDLARFLLNSLRGAIVRAKSETTERPMSLFLGCALSRSLLKRRKHVML
jgi:hypothetical protein